jgi:hypothetical protein
MYERTQNGETFHVSGNNVYVVTPAGNLRLHHVIEPAPTPPAPWRCLLAALRRLLRL